MNILGMKKIAVSVLLMGWPFMLLIHCEKDSVYQPPKQGLYTNPVFEPDLADPTIIRTSDGTFYAYGTENTWDDGKHRVVPVIVSRNLVDWSYVGEAFQEKPSWKEGGIWAPSIAFINNQYYLYYAFSTWGDQNAAIGLAVSDKPEGPFIDQGKIFDSQSIQVYNSIDPYVFVDDGRIYMLWGSLGGGIYGIELKNDGKTITGDKFQIAGNSFEAAYLYKRKGYYYLFVSTGSCCEGPNSLYRVVVGRSENLQGPYYTKTGKNLKDYNYSWWLPALDNIEGVVLRGNDMVAGPGHNAQIVTDDKGTSWFIYHGVLRSNPWLPGGATRRPLFIDKIEWISGWPVINQDMGPSLTTRQKPYFNLIN